MDDEYALAEEIMDDLLAEEMCCSADDAYDVWRDEQSRMLDEELKKLYNDFVKPVKHGYYKGNTEKFVEQVVKKLGSITECDIRSNDGIVIAVQKEKIMGEENGARTSRERICEMPKVVETTYTE